MFKMKKQKQPQDNFVTTSRISLKNAVILLKFWQAEGILIKSQAQLIKLSLEAFSQLIKKNHPDFQPSSSDEAFLFLQAAGLLDVDKVKNKKSLLDELKLESLNDSNEEKDDLDKGFQAFLKKKHVNN